MSSDEFLDHFNIKIVVVILEHIIELVIISFDKSRDGVALALVLLEILQRAVSDRDMSVVASSIVYFTSDAYETSIVLMMSIVIAESAAQSTSFPASSQPVWPVSLKP